MRKIMHWELVGLTIILLCAVLMAMGWVIQTGNRQPAVCRPVAGHNIDSD